MTYTKQLPSVHDFLQLSHQVDGYPVSRDELIWTAQESSFGSEMVDFLSQFSHDVIFRNPADFVNQSEELAILIYDEREMPPETLHSQQD